MTHKNTQTIYRSLLLGGGVHSARRIVRTAALRVHKRVSGIEIWRFRMKTTCNAMLLGIIAAFFGALLPTPANAQGIRVVADTITDNATSDKLYFTLGGTSTFQSKITVPNISPSGQSSWSINPGTTIQGVELYGGFLGSNQRAVLAVAARAQHDCDFLCWLSNIGQAVVTVIEGLGSVLTLDPQLAAATVGSLGSTIDSFANSLQGDATIGAFGLFAANTGGALISEFVPSSTARLLSKTGNSYVLSLFNGGFSYTITLHLEQYHGQPLQNVNSRLCIDVPNQSLSDGVQVQQYYCNGQKNQSWLRLFVNNGFVIVNENSGKCLDVRPNSNGDFTADHNAIQQFTCHFGPNQHWLPFLWPFPLANAGLAFINPNSNKCIDVPSASVSAQVPLQLYPCNFNGNQLWR